MALQGPTAGVSVLEGITHSTLEYGTLRFGRLQGIQAYSKVSRRVMQVVRKGLLKEPQRSCEKPRGVLEEHLQFK